MTVPSSTIVKLAIGALLFALLAGALTLSLDGAPPLIAYLATGSVFALAFKVAGEPLAIVPFRKGGRLGVVLSYFISALGMVLSIYVLWMISQYTRAGALA